MSEALPLREQARAEFRKALGEPHVLKVPGGEIDRWTLKRPGGTDLYVTLDAPELPNLVHLMISDPGGNAVEPIGSHVMRTIEEVRETIIAVVAQWKGGPDGPKVKESKGGV